MAVTRKRRGRDSLGSPDVRALAAPKAGLVDTVGGSLAVPEGSGDDGGGRARLLAWRRLGPCEARGRSGPQPPPIDGGGSSSSAHGAEAAGRRSAPLAWDQGRAGTPSAAGRGAGILVLGNFFAIHTV